MDLLPDPSLRVQRIIAATVILTQGGIAVTGAIVRVTASGLGCPTWPQCFPGSFIPVAVAEVPRVHQAVEFGNRMFTSPWWSPPRWPCWRCTGPAGGPRY